ncbi:hypothetical protein C8R48DRAFT_780263 [Suillus tomentosus]|nr:hypothetical protein C8R48DRAFT_780263 [Suillus tomentosus]
MSREPHHVPLPSIALTDLNIPQGPLHQGHMTRILDKPSRVEGGFNSTLADNVGRDYAPIVNVLEHVLKLKRRSRIWLCSTVAFTFIPLRAAHPFQTKADRSALIRSRHLIKKRVPPSFVAIGQGQPGAGKSKAFLAVDSEPELVHKLVHMTASRTTIPGDAATRVGALEALQQNT